MTASPDIGRTRVLVTGFSPFPKNPINATAALAPVVADTIQRAFPDVRATALVLPTEWQRGPWMLEDALLSATPDVLVSFGIASRAKGFEIETRALNACSDATDAAGCVFDGDTLDARAPDQLPASFPVVEMLRRLRAHGLPARPSRHAGLYLCNAVLFQALRVAHHLPRLARVGFVHLPAELPVPGRRQTEVNRSSPLTFQQATLGGAEVVAACLGRPLPRHVTTTIEQRIAMFQRRTASP